LRVFWETETAGRRRFWAITLVAAYRQAEPVITQLRMRRTAGSRAFPFSGHSVQK
jgi:hypothetical protein